MEKEDLIKCDEALNEMKKRLDLETKVTAFNKALKESGHSIVCAESITAGLLASTIASVAGASSVLKGSIVTYSRELKSGILKVDPRVIDDHSAESLETTVEMVYGLIKVYPSSDLYVAVTGIASPGTDEYPIVGEVGDVFVAVYYRRQLAENRLVRFKISFGELERNDIREKSVLKVLETVLHEIEKNNERLAEIVRKREIIKYLL